MRFLSGCCNLLTTLHHLFQHFLISPLCKANYQLIGSFQTLFPFQSNLVSKTSTFFSLISLFESLARSSREIYINSYSIQRACSLMLSLVSANTVQQVFHYSLQSTNGTRFWTNRRLPVFLMLTKCLIVFPIIL